MSPTTGGEDAEGVTDIVMSPPHALATGAAQTEEVEVQTDGPREEEETKTCADTPVNT